jgi:hypothetical protein
MCELGASETTLLDMDFVFSAPNQESVESIRRELADYPIGVEPQEVPDVGFSVTGSTGAITWNEAQLLKWVDYLIQVGRDAGCQFEGCGARVGEGQTPNRNQREEE